jgi:hypothetical protein
MASCLFDQALRRDLRPLRGLRFSAGRHPSSDLLDDLNEFIRPIPVMPGESHELASSFEYRVSILGSTTDRDAATPSEFNEPFVS